MRRNFTYLAFVALLLIGVGLGVKYYSGTNAPKTDESSKAAGEASGELAVDLNDKQAASVKVGKVGKGEEEWVGVKYNGRRKEM